MSFPRDVEVVKVSVASGRRRPARRGHGPAGQTPYRLVAQHAPTDAGLIAHQRPHCPVLAATPLLDTVRLARALHPELNSHNLDTLQWFLHIPQPINRHRAMPDVEATAQLFRRLLADGQRAGWRTLHRLEATAGLPPKKPPTPTGDQEELF